MTALRAVVGFCHKHVKAIRKRLIGKRNALLRPRKVQRPDVAGQGDGCYYDNEAADNVINEFIDGRKTAAAGGQPGR